MKMMTWIIASMVFGAGGLAEAGAQTPVVTVRLEDNQIGTVKTAPGITTRLSFLEPPVEIICGDLYDPGTGIGNFVIQRSGNDVFLKPITQKGVSNMFVKIGENGDKIYSFDLVIVPAAKAYRIVNVIGTRTDTIAPIRRAKTREAPDLPAIARIVPVAFNLDAPPVGAPENLNPEDLPAPPPPLLIKPKLNVNASGTLRRDVVKRVAAEYPEMARQRGVYGQVVVEVMIDHTGKVVAAKAVSGPLLLRGAAVVAAKLWRFSESNSGDDLSHSIGKITFNFQAPDKQPENFHTVSGGSSGGRGRRN